MKEAEAIHPVQGKAGIGGWPASVLVPAVACGATIGILTSITGNLLISMIAALVVPLMMWKPFLGLMGLVLLVPLEELTTFGYSFTLVRVVGASTFICWFFQVVLRRQKIKLDLFLWVALLFLAWSCCSLFWAVDRGGGIVAVFTITQLVLLYLMSCNIIDSDEKLRAFMSYYIAGAAIAAIIAILGAYEAGFTARASVSSMQNPNRFAHALSLGLILAVFLTCTCRGYQRYLYLFSAFPLALGVLLSGSRGTWLAVLASIAVAGLITKSKKVKFVLITILIIALLFNSAIISAMPPLIADRITSIANLADRGSGRLDIWMVGLEMVRENWLTGVGIYGFPTAYNDYIFNSYDEIRDRGVMRDAHSSFLCLLAELGLLGFLLFSMFWWAAWKSIGRLPGNPEKTLGICLLVFLFFVSLTATEHKEKFFWLGWLIVNMLSFSGRRNIENRQPEDKEKSSGDLQCI
ncbi:MAG: O-Antigen ligase [Pelotomaculum sp. PtaB.Bin104]|nr:MAG: O-Antigen ligase [Pelotomaculum sp. PtaB.Bin104]